MSNMDQYPRFTDGDVAIVAPTGHSWKLHSHILSQFCLGFRKLLLKDHGHVSKKQKTETKPSTQWKFNMVVIDYNEFFVDFRPVDISARQNMTLPVSTNGTGGKLEYLTTYDNLFRCFYNLDPDLDHEGGGNALIHHSVSLVQAAERIKALGPVRRVIESHLLRLGQVLWQRVVSMPHLFADLAIRLESPAIFKEAMIHLIGSWNLPDGMVHMDVSEGTGVPGYAKTIKAIAAKKVTELDERKREVELNLIHFVPPALRKEIVDEKIPGRAEYANDIYLWEAFTLIRQHITMALFSGQGRLAADGGAAFYRQLNLGGSAYLRPKALEKFLEDFPMTKKGEQKFECAMINLKEQYRGLTAELMVNNAQPFAAGAPPLGYLTLAVITDEDIPWIAEGNNVKPSSLLFPEVPDRTLSAAMSSFPTIPEVSRAANIFGEPSTPRSTPRYPTTATTSGEASTPRTTPKNPATASGSSAIRASVKPKNSTDDDVFQAETS